MPRKEPKPHDAESLEKVAERMSRVAARLRAVADIVKLKLPTGLQIVDHKSMLKGLGFVEQFASNSEAALEDALAAEYDARVASGAS